MSRSLGVFLGRLGLELVADEGFVADHPGVVPRLDEVRVAWACFTLRTVVVRDVKATGHDYPEVAQLAGVGSDQRLYGFGPPPAGIEGIAACSGTLQSDYVDSRLGRRPLLVRGVERASLCTGHDCSPFLISVGWTGSCKDPVFVPGK